MNQPPHLLLALSGHGYGHLAQCAPVINALWEKLPSLCVTVCSSLPEAVIAGRLDKPFTCLAVELDVVLPMASAWEVDVPAAQQAYSSFHQDIEAGLQRDSELLETIKPDLILADIPWRILLAAQSAGIPAVALCSLNWASIYAAYCGTDGASEDVLEHMWAGYRAADVFLAPEPAIDMRGLVNYHAIGPIARHGVPQKPALLEMLGLSRDTRVVLVALGGIATVLPLASWPRIENVAWIFSETPATQRDDLLDLSALSLSFIDALASSDAVLSKPGYGTYAEAVCNGIPLLTLERPDWPETDYLNAWVRRYGCLREISKQQFETGTFGQALQQLWEQPVPDECPEPTGIDQAAGLLLERLS
jgi:hypothetical protein